MISKLFLLLILISFQGLAFSYRSNLKPDSSKIVLFPKNYGIKKWKPLVGLDARRSYFREQKVKINGLRLGVQYNGVHRFGFGFYALKKKILLKDIFIDEIDAQTPTNLRINLQFTTIFYERVLFKIPKWEVALPVYLGNGNISTEYINNLGNYKTQSKTKFTVLGIGVNTKYYIFTWLAPRLTFGHRFVYNKNQDIIKALNKPFYSVGVSINPLALYKDLFKKD
jgi:hypothetical protein